MATFGGVLFIEPKGPKSDEPLVDDLTARVAKALEEPRFTGVMRAGAYFVKGRASMKKRVCSCGAVGEDVDYKLKNGMFTNSLAAHYMAYHRDEVPTEDLRLVRDYFSPTSRRDFTII